MDMERVILYVSQANPQAGVELARAFRARAEHLSSHPYLGREVFRRGQRELVVHKNYLLTYRISDRYIDILQVWHVARKR